MNWFDLTLQLKGFPIKKAKAKLEAIKNIPESSFSEYVEQQKQAVLDFHCENNSYYRKLCRYRKPQRWEDVPILTKADLQVPLEKRLSKGYTPKNCYVSKTSGSSGHPFTFAKNKFCHALTWANIMDTFGEYGINFNTSYQARFYGIPLDFIGNKKERLKDKLANRYRFPIFNLNDTVLSGYLKEFKKRKFDYINGYTSVLVVFAKYLKKQNICLKDICPTLKVAMTTSEMLFNNDRVLLQTQFGIPIVNEYGASEVGLIAFEDSTKQVKVCNKQLYVEILNNNNKVASKGETGKVVITDLYNNAHPFIRFEIGDLASLSNKSSTKHVYLQKLIGRTSDVAELPSGKRVPGLTFYYVTKQVIKDVIEVKEFVVKQTRGDSFIITYCSNKTLSKDLKTQIQKAFDTYLEPNLNITFERVDAIKRTKTGKLKQFSKAY